VMPDQHAAENATSEDDLDLLRARLSNLYVRKGLSPPTQLYDAVKSWRGLSFGEIVAAVEAHFVDHRHEYRSGSGDGLFHVLQADIRRAWQAKHPPRDRTDEELERPRRRRAGGVRKVYNAGGRPDMLVDALVDDAPDAGLREPESNAERPSAMPGYEGSGAPILEDDEAE
jgi:hypothetical protein